MSGISEAQKIRDKYAAIANAEVEALQSTCKHEEITDWLEYHWAPAHGTGTYFKLCKRCDKSLHEKTHCQQFKGNGWCGKEIVDMEIIRLSELVKNGKYTYDDFKYSETGLDGKTYQTLTLQEPCCKTCFDEYVVMVKKKRKAT